VAVKLEDSAINRAGQGVFHRLTPGTNLPPVANPDTFWLEGLKPFNFTTGTWPSYQLRLIDNDTDPENDYISLLGVGTPNVGTVKYVNVTSARYFPAINASGPATFIYGIGDAAGNASEGQVSVNMLPSQDSPEQVQRLYLGRALDRSNFLSDAQFGSDGSLYVTGTSGQRQDLGSTVGVAIKYLPDGTTGWSFIVYADANTKAPVQFVRIVVSSDRIFFVGQTYNATTGWDIWVSACTPSSSEYFESTVALPTDDYVNDAKLDPDGNLVVGGYIGTEGATVMKFDRDTNLLWRRGIGGSSGNKGAINRVSIATDGTIYAAGYVSNGSNDILAASYQSNGDLRWSKTTAFDGREYLNDVTVDRDGNPVFVGTKIGIEPIVFKLSSVDGSLIRNFNVSLSGYLSGDARYAASGPGGVVVAGHRTRTSDGTVQPFVLQLTPNLDQSWLTEFVPPYSAQLTKPLGSIYPSALTLDPSGAAYVTSYAFLNDNSSMAAYVASFDPNGGLRWSRFRQSPTRSYSYWNSVAVNDQGSVAVAGNHAWALPNDANALQGTLALYQQTPIPVADAYEVPVGGTLTVPAAGVLANDRFVGDGTTNLTKKPASGKLTLNADGSFTYSPPRTTTATQTFQYTIQRSNLPVSTAGTVTLSFVAKPIAVRDYASATPGIATPIDVLANDSDPASRPLFVESVTLPSKGTTSIVDGTVVYVPSTTATGNDTFSYTVSNGVATATATVTVKLVPDPAITALRPYQINVGQSNVTVRVLGRNFGAVPGAVVLWNGVERATTYVSASEVDFVAPNDALTAPGNASIVVQMPLGRTSNAVNLPIIGTPKFTVTAGRRQANNSVVFAITNIGTATAQTLTVQSATVNGVSSLTTPSISPSLGVGEVANVTLTFPASAFSTPRQATCVMILSFVGGTMRQSVTIRY
jgi:Bacterial Ig domain